MDKLKAKIDEIELKKQKGESLSAVEIDIIALYERRMRRREMSMEERIKEDRMKEEAYQKSQAFHRGGIEH